MKMSAQAYLERDPNTKMFEKSIDLVNEVGSVKQRYYIQTGRYVNGTFTPEVASQKSLQPSNTPLTVPSPPTNPPKTRTTTNKQRRRATKKPKTKPAELVYGTCRKPDDGALMISCENSECPIEWFHGRCAGTEVAPPESEKWWCEGCAEGREGEGVVSGAGEMGRAAKRNRAV